MSRGVYWGGSAAARIRARVLARDAGRCALCGHYGANSVDHIVPRSRGGTHEMDNLRAAHSTCNARRGNRAAGPSIDERTRW